MDFLLPSIEPSDCIDDINESVVLCPAKVTESMEREEDELLRKSVNINYLYLFCFMCVIVDMEFV